jgi:hypothetical protein
MITEKQIAHMEQIVKNISHEIAQLSIDIHTIKAQIKLMELIDNG